MDRNKQIARLKSGGIDAWNLWREQNPNARIDLAGAKLQRAVLYQANLQGATLYQANLQGANLQGASLPRANLQKANLLEVNLQEANLQGAILRWADLQGADLRGANLYGATLQGATLKRATLKRATLKGALLQRATYNRDTRWPDRFTPPGDAILVDDDPSQEELEQEPQPEHRSTRTGTNPQKIIHETRIVHRRINETIGVLQSANADFFSTPPNEKLHLKFHREVKELFNDLTAKLTEAEQRIGKLSIKLAASEQRVSELTTELAASAQREEQLKGINEAFREQVQELRQEIAGLQTLLDEASKKYGPFKKMYLETLGFRAANLTINLAQGVIGASILTYFGAEVCNLSIATILKETADPLEMISKFLQ